MADILKIVGEKWKSLPDKERIIYQNKAQTEKEVAKAKISDQMAQESSGKNPIP